jgi:hypothetical protein
MVTIAAFAARWGAPDGFGSGSPGACLSDAARAAFASSDALFRLLAVVMTAGTSSATGFRFRGRRLWR